MRREPASGSALKIIHEITSSPRLRDGEGKCLLRPFSCEDGFGATGTPLTTAHFEDLGLSEPIQRALREANYTTPTPIQAKAIPLLLKGQDLFGIAQTGTGKTAAFALPILEKLAAARQRPAPKTTHALILAPTRELAIQIDDSFKTYGRHLPLRSTVIVGGVGMQPQIRALGAGVDVLVATPGRLLDHLGSGHVRLDRVSFLVLDEADRMFDMGFIRDVRKIVARLPEQRQSSLFSATMAPEIAKLAAQILRNPQRIDITPQTMTVDRIQQSVVFVNQAAKLPLLVRLLGGAEVTRAIVFTRTKRGADRVARQIDIAGASVAVLHGNKSQNARQRALESFSSGKARVLVATDIAARGIDIDDVTHIFNFEMPNEPESYVHRIGRTARRGASGIALSLCDPTERQHLRAIEKLTGQQVTVLDMGESTAHSPREAPLHRGRAADPSPAAPPSRRGPPRRPRHSRAA